MRPFFASTLAGSPLAGNVDSSFELSSFSRPAGILSFEKFIFVVDRSIGTSVRVLFDGKVKSIRWRNSQELLQPCGLALFESYLLIADRGHDKIRYINLGEINTKWFNILDTMRFELQTMQLPGLKKPTNILAHKNMLFISDQGNHRILRIQISAQQGISVKAPQILCNTPRPEGICVLNEQHLLFCDSSLHKIFQIEMEETEANPSVFAGSAPGFLDGSVENAQFRGPIQVKIDEENTVYVLEKDNSAMRIIKNGVVTTICQGRGYKDGFQPTLDDPSDFIVQKFQFCTKIILADTRNACIRVLEDTQIGSEFDNTGKPKDVQTAKRTPPLQKALHPRPDDALSPQVALVEQAPVEYNYKIAPYDVLHPLLQKIGTNALYFFKLLTQGKYTELLDYVSKLQEKFVYPVAFSYLAYFNLTREFNPKQLHEGAQRNNSALEFFKKFASSKLLVYEKQLLKTFVADVEQHAGLLAICNGYCVKIRFSINNNVIKLNQQNQFIVGKDKIIEENNVVFEIQITSDVKHFDQITSEIRFAGGLVNDQKVIYVPGQKLEVKGEQLSIFYDKFTFKMTKEQLQSVILNNTGVMQYIHMKIWNKYEFQIGVEAGSGPLKRSSREISRQFELEETTIAVFV
ncbi:Conserved_hypothetical protein [Hexamita inflata]|uniref:Uncharacterized protein n=1 Tax=Hexamita inflata TaxID=28002 RepID=A0AA86QHZ8_9EUKA|nr:Conserved hypothetical protein [Hexamita inflata]